MGTVLTLARRQSRRGRGQLTTVALLILLAAALVNLGVIVAIDYPQAVAERARVEHAPDLQFSLTDQTAAADLIAALRADPRVATVEDTPVLTERASFSYAGSTLPTPVAFVDLDRAWELGRFTIEESAPGPISHGVYLPQILRDGGGYAIGDTFTLDSLAGKRDFRVQGFFANAYLGTVTMGLTGIGLRSADYAALAAEPLAPQRARLIQASLHEPAYAAVASAATDQMIAAAASRGQPPPQVWGVTWDLVRSASLIGSGVYAGALVLFALVVLVVAMVVSQFFVGAAIRQDMVAIGALAAVGVAAAHMRRALAVPAIATIALSASAGVGLSYLVLPSLATALSAQSGIPWGPGFTVVALAIAVLVPAGAVALGVVLASRRLRRIAPVDALRGGAPAHSFRRNVLPLARSRGNLRWTLGAKQAWANAAQGALIIAVISLVTFAAMFAVSLYSNVLANPDNFGRMLIGESAEVSAEAVSSELVEPILTEVRKQPGVQRAYGIDYLQGTVSGMRALVVVTPDWSVQAYSSVYAGREPRYANEVAIGDRMAAVTGKGVGDSISLSVGRIRQSFLIVGLVNTISYNGLRADLTDEGYRRLAPAWRGKGVAVFVTAGTSPAAVLADLQASQGSRLASAIDNRASIHSQLDVYLRMCAALALGILVVTAVVAALVMGLLASTLIRRERRSFGVRKAIGFTSGQLVGQTVVSYLPAVLFGTLLGAGVSVLLVGPVLEWMLRAVGVVTRGLTLDPWLVGAVAGGLSALALGIVLVRSLSLRRTPTLTLMA